MPRDLRAGENTRRAKARREFALERRDLREATVPRQAAAGPTSHCVKARDPAVDEAVALFMLKKQIEQSVAEALCDAAITREIRKLARKGSGQ